VTIPGRRRWVLWRLERGLRRSDPHLAAMLAIFARLTVGEAIASREQRRAACHKARQEPVKRGGLLRGCGASTLTRIDRRRQPDAKRPGRGPMVTPSTS
jgi:hypothetical protein